MRITRRTGGGRGDYEISEHAGNLSPHDLVNHIVRLHFRDDIVLNTGTILRYRNGKFRLRAEDSPLHIPRQVAAALLMPHPVRANAALRSGLPILRRNAYAIQHITFSPNVTLGGGMADAFIDRIIVKNTDHDDEEIIVTQRLQDLSLVWARRAEFPDMIQALLEEHEAIVRSGGPLPERTEQIVRHLELNISALSPDLEVDYLLGSDVLGALLESLREGERNPPLPVEQIDTEDVELRRRNVRRWRRWANTRGAQSARFRQSVRAAYHAKCVVCGSSFPSTSQNSMPGVEAAHILPWAQYDLDNIQNGLCLCKTHHWAFDEGLIQIEYSEGYYNIVVPTTIITQIQAEAPAFDVEALMRYAGPIPDERLPDNYMERPRPEFLERLRVES